jgi:hypothetical protein
MEVDSSLVSDPAKLQERIRQLFALVRTSLAAELNGGNGNGHTETRSTPAPATRAASNGNGASRPAPAKTGSPRPATQSQIKAIFAIARNQQIDVPAFLKERFQVRRPDDLSIKQASEVIDELKSLQSQESSE